jgi:prophage DNA circulation protein
MSLLARNYQQASFRGISFKVADVDSDFGRRTVTHEYPQRDTPSSEDLGRKKREFSVEAYMVGSGYEKNRDALIKACEISGSGTLIHPYLGNKLVVCTGCRVRESSRENGICYFTLSFVEAGKEEFPSVSKDRITALFNAATGAMDAASNAFANAFTVDGAPSFVLNSATDKITQFADLADAQRAKVRATTEALADFTYKIRNLKATVNDIISTPSELAAQMRDVIQALVDLVPGGSNEMKSALSGVLTYGSAFPSIGLTTVNRELESSNAEALKTFNERIVVAQQTILATNLTFDSFEQAETERTKLTDSIDEVMEASEDDDVFLSFQKIRSELVRAVPSEAQDLPNLIEFTPEASICSLVLTYNLYDSMDEELNIVSRNHIRNPSFIRAGVPLEVVGAT